LIATVYLTIVVYGDDNSSIVAMNKDDTDDDGYVSIAATGNIVESPHGSMVALKDTEDVMIKITNDGLASSDGGTTHISIDVAVEMSTLTKAEQFYLKIYR